jgi:hypothetical protein
VHASEGVQIVRIQVTDVQPKDLAPKVNRESATVRISPLLLNPGDTITFGVITSGEKPLFKARVRIAGVQSVSIDDGTARKENVMLRAIHFVTAFLLFILYFSFGLALFRGRRYELSKLIIAIAAIASGFGSMILIVALEKDLTYSIARNPYIALPLTLLAGAIAIYANRRRAPATTPKTQSESISTSPPEQAQLA